MSIINRDGRELLAGRFLNLTDSELRKCDTTLTSLPPANNKIDRANMALEEGIPFEYLVDMGIIIDREDVSRLTISVDEAININDYIKFKKNPRSLDKAKVCVVVNDLTEFKTFTENLSTEKVEFSYITDEGDLDEILSDENLVGETLNFILTEDISSELSKMARELHKSLLEAELKFTFIDLKGILNISGGVYRLREYNDKISILIQNEKYSVLRNISDDSNVNLGDVDLEDSEDSDIESVGEDLEENGSEKEIEHELEEEIEEETEAAVNTTKALEEIQREKENTEAMLEAVKNDLKTKYEREINSLKDDIQLKLKNIESLNNRLKNAVGNYNDELEKNVELRSKMQDLKKEINETREANSYLKETKIEYDRIIGDYNRLTIYEKENEDKIKSIIEDYDNKINGYLELIDNYEKDAAELQKEYSKLLLVSSIRENNRIISYLTMVEAKIIYFNMIDDLLYFNTIVSALYSELKTKGKVLIMSVKNLRDIDRLDWEDWGTLENPKDKILIEDIDIKAVKLIEDISKGYDYIIALDYACEDRLFIKSIETDVYDVVKSKDRQHILGYNNTLISPTEDSFVDIKFDDKIDSKRNSIARQIYIRRNKNIWKFFKRFEDREKVRKEELKKLLKEEKESLKEVGKEVEEVEEVEEVGEVGEVLDDYIEQDLEDEGEE